MKTVRFTQVVTKCGKPVVHDQWLSPQKDPTLKKAVKENRLMTIHIHTVGSAKDYGEVGLAGKGQRVLLIFPKSLRSFTDRRVVGIDYDLLKAPAERPAKKAAKPAPAKTAKSRPESKSSETVLRLFRPDETQEDQEGDKAEEPKSRQTKSKSTGPSKAKAPKLKPPNPIPKAKTLAAETRLRSQIKRALQQLKSGKAVLAYQTLEKALQ